MRLIHVCIVATYLFLFLGTLCGALLGARSFTKGQRDKYPILKRLDGKQVQLLALLIIFTAAALIANGLKDYLGIVPTPMLARGPGGEITQRATVEAARAELMDAASALAVDAEAYFSAGEADYERKRYRDAAANYQKSVGLLPTMSAYLNLGDALIFVGELHQAEQASLAGLRLAREKSNKVFEGVFLSDLCGISGGQGKSEEALQYCRDAVEVVKQTKNQYTYVVTLYRLGSVYDDLMRFDEALDHYEEALKVAEELGDLYHRAVILNNVGVTYLKLGRLDEALARHLESLRIHKQRGDRYEFALTLGNIGNVYSGRYEFEEAIKAFEEALPVSKESDDFAGYANILGKLGHVYDMQGRHNEALRCYLEALEANGEVHDPAGRAFILLNMGMNQLSQKRDAEALETLQTASDIYAKIHNPLAQATALWIMGEAYSSQGKKAEALKCLTKARDIYMTYAPENPSLERVESLIIQLNSLPSSR